MTMTLFPYSRRHADPRSPVTTSWRAALSLAVDYAVRQSAAQATLAHAAMRRCLNELERIGALTESDALAEAEADEPP